MLIKNKTNQGQSYFLGDRRYTFTPLQEKDVPDTIGRYLLNEFSSVFEKDGSTKSKRKYEKKVEPKEDLDNHENLIIDNPDVDGDQELLNE